MAIVTRFIAYFENGVAFVSYNYDDAVSDANRRVLRFDAENNASQDMKITAVRASDSARFELVCEPGFARNLTLNNTGAQRITVDAANPSKPRMVGVQVDVQYPWFG